MSDDGYLGQQQNDNAEEGSAGTNSSKDDNYLHMGPAEGQDFLIAKHKAFFKRCLSGLPGRCRELDTTRLTIVFFCVSGLDLLNELDGSLSEEDRSQIIEWVYAHQVPTTTGMGGWSGWSEESSHLALSYAALSTLIILGDDLSRVNRAPLLASVASSKLQDGSFSSHCNGGENDARFVYCAAVICYVIGDWRPFNVNNTTQFIRNCLNYDGGFGQRPRCESHGGSTYCCLAALKLMNRLDALSPEEMKRLRRWLVMKQTNGFHGRANKPDDSCYSFWISASLHIIDAISLIHSPTAIEFTLSCQDNIVGGFGKYSDSDSDALHSYLSIAGMTLLGKRELQPLHPALNVSLRASQSLEKLHHLSAEHQKKIIEQSSNCCAES